MRNKNENKNRRSKAKKIFGDILIVGVVISVIATLIVCGIIAHRLNGVLQATNTLIEKLTIDEVSGVNDKYIDETEKIVVVANESLTHTDKNTFTCESERELIERVVAAEARGEEYIGMVAVAQTIKDRGDLWGMTYTEVVNAPNQYAPPYRGTISDEVKQAVSDVFDNGYRAFEEPITHFHSGSAPYWANEKVNRGTIGRHSFYF